MSYLVRVGCDEESFLARLEAEGEKLFVIKLRAVRMEYVRVGKINKCERGLKTEIGCIHSLNGRVDGLIRHGEPLL